MTIKTHTESSKTELSSGGKRPFKVWCFLLLSGAEDRRFSLTGEPRKTKNTTCNVYVDGHFFLSFSNYGFFEESDSIV